MRKVLCVCAVVVALCSPAMSAGRQEMKRMGVFLSNFTELGMYDVDAEDISDAELVHFGIWHNYVNNYRTRIEDCPDGEGCPYGWKVIRSSHVAGSVKKYFDLELGHVSIEGGHYDGRYYHFMPADGEIPYYADVQEVSQRGRVITMRGELYSSEDRDDRPATFTATVKPYRYGGKDTWAIITLKTKWRR